MPRPKHTEIRNNVKSVKSWKNENGHEIEPNWWKDRTSVWNEFIMFILTVQFIYLYVHASTKYIYLSYWAVEIYKD
jgi:hypothetical protein